VVKPRSLVRAHSWAYAVLHQIAKPRLHSHYYREAAQAEFRTCSNSLSSENREGMSALPETRPFSGQVQLFFRSLLSGFYEFPGRFRVSK
jgi:hypothetical protein